MSAPSVATKRVPLPVVKLTPEAFKPFGQVIGPTDDGKMFDHQDAQLVLDAGTPRFYIMRIPRRGMSFNRITYHAKVTQCLGTLAQQPWYMVVAAPSFDVAAFPAPADLVAFEIPPGVFVKMDKGCWHAGPLFDNADHQDYYNLELSDTNQVDHNTHDYLQHDGTVFELQHGGS